MSVSEIVSHGCGYRCKSCGELLPADDPGPEDYLCPACRAMAPKRPEKSGAASSVDIPYPAQNPGICSQCAHFRRCSWLVSAELWWSECDWWPRRYLPKGAQ